MTTYNVRAAGAEKRKALPSVGSVSYPSAGSPMTGSAGVSSDEVNAFADWLARPKPAHKTKIGF